MWKIAGPHSDKPTYQDLAGHQVTRENTGIDESCRAVESLYQRVADLFHNRQA
jgi:hypothetical protein